MLKIEINNVEIKTTYLLFKDFIILNNFEIFYSIILLKSIKCFLNNKLDKINMRYVQPSMTESYNILNSKNKKMTLTKINI